MSGHVTHPTADVSANARIGPGTQIWHHVQIREDAVVGAECVLGKNVYVDHGVIVGDRCKIENNASLFYGVTLEDGVFIGPHACLTNDRYPRATRPDGRPKGADDWTVGRTYVKRGASIGAGAIVLPGITIGEFALIAAGAVVTSDVVPYGLAVGNPARVMAFVCRCGRARSTTPPEGDLRCARCAEPGVASGALPR